MRECYVIGNWKMNQDIVGIKDFFARLSEVKQEIKCHAWVAPQALHIPIVKEFSFTTGNVEVGGQNCSDNLSGAFTGEISPTALKDVGAHFVLIGHSERRTLYKESGDFLNRKVKASIGAGLVAVFCLGETLDEREKGKTEEVLRRQLDEGLSGLEGISPRQLVVAYEPVWAIGTGKTATKEMAAEAHGFIRSHISTLQLSADETAILYGGSVKPDNISELLSQGDIDGALVGGASLSGESFGKLCLAGSLAK